MADGCEVDTAQHTLDLSIGNFHCNVNADLDDRLYHLIPLQLMFNSVTKLLKPSKHHLLLIKKPPVTTRKAVGLTPLKPGSFITLTHLYIQATIIQK